MFIDSVKNLNIIQYSRINFGAKYQKFPKRLTTEAKNFAGNEKNIDFTISNLVCSNDYEYQCLISSLKYFLKRDRGTDRRIFDTRTPIEKNMVLRGGYYSPYSKAPNNLLGLIPYCGYFCIYSDINNFLKYSKNGILATLPAGVIPQDNKLLLDTDSKLIKDFIKCLNYSLSKLDDRYGVHKGIVYRGGIFDGKVKQFYSTSAEVSPYVQIHLQGQNDLQFHIINTKNGHKIYKFQEDYYKPEEISMFDIEKEVLISSGEYKEVSNRDIYLPQIKKFANALSANLVKHDKKYTSEYIENKIKVWEEI